MADLINKQMAIDAVEKEAHQDGQYYGYLSTTAIIRILEGLPAFNPAKNGGCWGCLCALCGQGGKRK